jgi:hypothetical protein
MVTIHTTFSNIQIFYFGYKVCLWRCTVFPVRYEFNFWPVVNYVSGFEGVFYNLHVYVRNLILVFIRNVLPASNPHMFCRKVRKRIEWLR